MANYRPGFQRSNTDFPESNRIPDVEGLADQSSTASKHSGSFGKSPIEDEKNIDEKRFNEKFVNTDVVLAYDDEQSETVGSGLSW